MHEETKARRGPGRAHSQKMAQPRFEAGSFLLSSCSLTLRYSHRPVVAPHRCPHQIQTPCPSSPPCPEPSLSPTLSPANQSFVHCSLLLTLPCTHHMMRMPTRTRKARPSSLPITSASPGKCSCDLLTPRSLALRSPLGLLMLITSYSS